ncbi:MAG TPA: NADH:flavin oxidoreductase [Solirubrobacteraceae bacterium]|jgi:2,4-dienoyl-CoA reductase-like NADH-dependent reductase (Old Yellow Enzyme family)|nr:NADH:flavin oxidoreductase [Solirubrobacteraceae bacterium]
MSNAHPLLTPVRVAGAELPNRVAVAPMSRVSTAGDGVPTDAMVDYYASYARGGFGLIVSEGTYTDHAHSQAYPNQPAIVTDEQVRAWARVTDAVHAAGGRIFLQLMHAGALVQGNHHRDVAVAPSAVQPLGRKLLGYGGEGPYAMPREMTLGDVEEAVAGFAASAARARTAGFDGVEVHGANGYLLDQFLTTYTNRRTDAYGGSPANRARIFVEVLEAIRAAAGDDFPVGVRVSQVKVNDLEYRWSGPEEAREIFERLAAGGPAYVHVASEGAHWDETSFLAPGVSITGLAREVTGAPVIANGGMHDERLAARVLDDGHADLVSLGHGALANPDWPQRLAAGRRFAEFDPDMLRPEVTIENTLAWRRDRRERAAGAYDEAVLAAAADSRDGDRVPAGGA